MRRLEAALAAVAAGILLAGCSGHVTGDQHQVRDIDGMIVGLSALPGLPENIGDNTDNSGAQVGDDTLVVTLNDDKTNAPVPNANVTASGSTSLVDQQRPESGRAQGNGVYYVPIRFGVPDTYNVMVTIDRPGKPETTVQFKVAAG